MNENISFILYENSLYLLFFRKRLRIFQAVYRARAKTMGKRGEFLKEPYVSEYYVI